MINAENTATVQVDFGHDAVRATIDPAFFSHCAFISVDLQDGGPQQPIAESTLHDDWRAMGFTVDDVNAAYDYAWGVALPNAAAAAAACAIRNMPRIFVHWGFRLPGGMDLDPAVRAKMLRQHGPDCTKWPGHIGHPGARPASRFNVQPQDYVIAKTSQDAFASTPLSFVLTNLRVRNLVFVGGHTEACLGKSAQSAKRLGYRTLCVEDATSNARESTRFHGIIAAEFDYVVTAETFLHAAKCAAPTPSRKGV